MTVIGKLPKRKRTLPVERAHEATQIATTFENPRGEKPQGEIAKEQLMRALAITSTLISEAKDAAINGKE